MSDDTIKRLREAIAARPTPGPWEIRAERYRFIHVYATGGGICHLDTVDGEGAANAKLIAAASPDNIAALLDRLDKAELEIERLHEDAERYRWLRGREDGRYMTVYAFRTDIDEVCLGDELDSAIDAARAAEQSDEV